MGVCDYLTGCRQVLLSPRVDDDGKLRESLWFDESRVEIDAAVPSLVLNLQRRTSDALKPAEAPGSEGGIGVDGPDIAAPGGTRKDSPPTT